jgi:hypothetical protein
MLKMNMIALIKLVCLSDAKYLSYLQGLTKGLSDNMFEYSYDNGGQLTTGTMEK